MPHCRRFQPAPLSRRDMLRRCANGFGAVALAALLQDRAYGVAADLAVVRSMVSNFSEHTNANYFFHSGHGQQGRPSMGAWVTYGLGSACRDLPGFVVLDSGLIPPGGLDCFNSGFLPASYQGSLFRGDGAMPVADVHRSEASPEIQENKLALLRRLDADLSRRQGHDDRLEAAIANYELAFRMQ